MEKIADARSQGEKSHKNSDDVTYATESKTRNATRILSDTAEPSAATSLTAQLDAVVFRYRTSVRANALVRL